MEEDGNNSKELLISLSTQLFCISSQQLVLLPRIFGELKNLQLVTVLNHQLNLAKSQVHYLEKVFEALDINIPSLHNQKFPMIRRLKKNFNDCEAIGFEEHAVIDLVGRMNKDKIACLRLITYYASDMPWLKDMIDQSLESEIKANNAIKQLMIMPTKNTPMKTDETRMFTSDFTTLSHKL